MNSLKQIYVLHDVNMKASLTIKKLPCISVNYRNVKPQIGYSNLSNNGPMTNRLLCQVDSMTIQTIVIVIK